MPFGPVIRHLLRVLVIRPERCYVEVDGQRLVVQQAWVFSGAAPRASVRRARRWDRRRPISVGVHGWRGRWLVNTGRDDLVTIELDPPMRASTLLVPLRVRELTVNVDDPDGLVAALSPDATDA